MVDQSPSDLAPSNLEAEMALLGLLLCDNAAFNELDGLTAAQFHEPFFARVFGAIGNAVRKDLSAEPIGISAQFAADPAFEELGGIRFIGDLIDRAPPPRMAPHFARLIADASQRRALVALGTDVSFAARAPDADPAEILADLERQAGEIARGAVTSERWTRAGDMVANAIAYARTRSGQIDYTFGVADVDEYVGGLNAGETTLLAGRPGMGKTVAAQTIARANAAKGRGVCFFSLEMAAHPLGLRLATDVAYRRNAPVFSAYSSRANPTADAAMKHLLSNDEWDRLDQAQAQVRDWPLMIETRPGLTMSQIEAMARRQHRAWEKEGIEPGPVIVDHIGKVRPEKDRKGSMHAEMADKSNAVAEMAKRLGVPVLALVQLNRGVENREDKRPGLSDLRQAGELEEDARQVIFLYRPEYYLRDGFPGEPYQEEIDRKAKLMEVEKQLFWIVEKNSHGPRGQVQTFCDIACSAIRSRDP